MGNRRLAANANINLRWSLMGAPRLMINKASIGVIDSGFDGRRNFLEHLQPFSAYFRLEIMNPMMLPPGRAKLVTSPLSTGSPMVTSKMGIVFVSSAFPEGTAYFQPV
jgi:hypothetical protein